MIRLLISLVCTLMLASSASGAPTDLKTEAIVWIAPGARTQGDQIHMCVALVIENSGDHETRVVTGGTLALREAKIEKDRRSCVIECAFYPDESVGAVPAESDLRIVVLQPKERALVQATLLLPYPLEAKDIRVRYFTPEKLGPRFGVWTGDVTVAATWHPNEKRRK